MRKPPPNRGLFIIALLALACRSASSRSSPGLFGSDAVVDAPQLPAGGAAAGTAGRAMLGGVGGGAVQDAPITPAGYGLPPGSSIKVLWIGNSLTGAPEAMGAATGWTPMPDRLVPMLAELGITMTYGSVILGGAECSTHAANPTTMAEIANPTYGIVNFQSSYDNAGDAAAYTTAVRPLYTAAHNAGSIALFEGIWEFGGFGSYQLDYGGPLNPAAENAVEGAAAALPGSFPVQVGHCWQAVKNRRAALIPKMHADGVHQSVLGEYFNALVYARFFSARAVRGITSVHPLVVAASTADERQLLRETVDGCVTIFYR